MTDYYLDNPDHPLNGKFRSEKDWGTDIFAINFNLPEETRYSLIKTIAKHAYQEYDDYRPDGRNSGYSSRHHYNMFGTPEWKSDVNDYKEIANELIRYYVANAWDVEDVENMVIKAKCFGNIQTYGQRTYPHYHHGFDGVLITYLTVGEEFTISKECMDNGDWDNFVGVLEKPEIKEGYASINVNDMMNAQTHRPPSTHPKEFEKGGNMLLLDPLARSYPYNRKARAITPENGLSVLHPGYLYHESNTYTGAGIRVAIIINFNVHNSSADSLTDL